MYFYREKEQKIDCIRSNEFTLSKDSTDKATWSLATSKMMFSIGGNIQQTRNLQNIGKCGQMRNGLRQPFSPLLPHYEKMVPTIKVSFCVSGFTDGCT